MPWENKELSKSYNIKFLGCIDPHLNIIRGMTKFEIVFPDGSERSIRPVFRREFIQDYFRILGNHTDRRLTEILEGKKDLFKLWGLIRIEERLNNNSFVEEPEISSEDFQWAKKVEKGHIQPSSVRQSDGSYLYIPDSKIGFNQ